MSRKAMVAGVIISALASNVAIAQSTVGEVLDAGGKALTKVELIALLPGATVSGPTAGGGQMYRTIKADGTMAGNVQNLNGKNAAQEGEWKIEDDGQLCVSTSTRFRETTNASKSCGYYYKLGDKYFAAVEGGERGTRVLERSIKK